MRAVDTNVLLRHLVNDDARQALAADAFLEKGAWVSHLVLAETIWVLGARFDVNDEDMATVIEMLLGHTHLTIQDADVVAAALDQYRRTPKLGFSDCLVVEIARKAGHLPLGTFDKALSKVDGTELL